MARLLWQHERGPEAAEVIAALLDVDGPDGVDERYRLVLRSDRARYLLDGGPSETLSTEVDQLLVDLGAAELPAEQHNLAQAYVHALDSADQTERADEVWTTYIQPEG